MSTQKETEKAKTQDQFFNSDLVKTIIGEFERYFKDNTVKSNTPSINNDELSVYLFVQKPLKCFSFSTLITLDGIAKRINENLKLSWLQTGGPNQKYWIEISVRMCKDPRDAIFLLG